MHKDIRLALEAAKEARVKLPGLETVEEVYEMATEDGHRDLDYAATLTFGEMGRSAGEGRSSVGAALLPGCS